MRVLAGDDLAPKAAYPTPEGLLVGTFIGLHHYPKHRLRAAALPKLFGATDDWHQRIVSPRPKTGDFDKIAAEAPTYAPKRPQAEQVLRFGNSRLRSLLVTPTEWYVGLEEGLFRLTEGRTQRLTTGADTGQVFIASALAQHPDGSVYVATFLGELHRFQAGTWLATWALDSTQAIAIQDIARVGEHLWLGTSEGLYRWRPANTPGGQAHTEGPLRELHGLPIREIFDLLPAASGCWLATASGLTWVPTSAWQAPQPVAVAFVSATCNGEAPTSATEQGIELSTTQRNLSIMFRPKSLLPGARFTLRYRLTDGSNKRSAFWQELQDPSLPIPFRNLLPGAYQLEVQACQGSDCGPILSLPLYVRPKWFERLWVQASLAMLVLGGVAAGYRWNATRRLRMQQLRASLRLSQLQALRAQMNPHFVFNSLNSLYAAILAEDRTRAAKLLDQFATLMRHVLHYSEQEFITWEEEKKGLTLYLALQQARYKDRLTIVWAEPSPPLDTASLPAFMLQPFIENAIEHGLDAKPAGGTLTINVEQRSMNQLYVCVQDNGIGRAAAAELQRQQQRTLKSYATRATQQRIDLCNNLHDVPVRLELEDLYDVDQQPAGTRVHIYLPLEHPIAPDGQPQLVT